MASKWLPDRFITLSRRGSDIIRPSGAKAWVICISLRLFWFESFRWRRQTVQLQDRRSWIWLFPVPCRLGIKMKFPFVFERERHFLAAGTLKIFDWAAENLSRIVDHRGTKMSQTKHGLSLRCKNLYEILKAWSIDISGLRQNLGCCWLPFRRGEHRHIYPRAKIAFSRYLGIVSK